MKKILIISLVTVFLAGIGFWIRSGKSDVVLGRGSFSSFDTLAGSSSNFVSLPREAVFANSTTTDATNTFSAGAQVGYLDGGTLITQSFNTDGYDWVELAFAGQAGSATSTMFARLQLYDGTDWSDVHATTTAAYSGNATSTAIAIQPTGFQIDLSTASTTLFRYPFYVQGSKQGRFVMYADDLLTDPADGVQVWAKVIKIEPFQR